MLSKWLEQWIGLEKKYPKILQIVWYLFVFWRESSQRQWCLNLCSLVEGSGGSVVKAWLCSSEGCEFKSQHAIFGSFCRSLSFNCSVHPCFNRKLIWMKAACKCAAFYAILNVWNITGYIQFTVAYRKYVLRWFTAHYLQLNHICHWFLFLSVLLANDVTFVQDLSVFAL